MRQNYNDYRHSYDETPEEVVETPVAEETVEAKNVKTAKAIVKCSALNVRSMAETTADVLEIVSTSTVLKVLNGGTTVNGFIAVETPSGKSGFVMKQFVEIK